jgi:hypothetical protein
LRPAVLIPESQADNFIRSATRQLLEFSATPFVRAEFTRISLKEQFSRSGI